MTYSIILLLHEKKMLSEGCFLQDKIPTIWKKGSAGKAVGVYFESTDSDTNLPTHCQICFGRGKVFIGSFHSAKEFLIRKDVLQFVSHTNDLSHVGNGFDVSNLLSKHLSAFKKSHFYHPVCMLVFYVGVKYLAMRSSREAVHDFHESLFFEDLELNPHVFKSCSTHNVITT